MTSIATSIATGLIVGALTTLAGAPFWAAFGFGYLTFVVTRATHLVLAR